MRRSFIVSLNVPTDARVAEVRRYIQSAVAEMHGCLCPDPDNIFYSPMSELDADSVRVKSVPKKRK